MNQITFCKQLENFCCANLTQALNPETHLYDRQLRNNRWEATQGTENLTSTCICLIGIDRAGINLEAIGLKPAQTLNAVFKLANYRPYLGGIGLIIWANAVYDGILLKELQPQINISFNHFADYMTSLTSMETAWLVTGLLHEYNRTQDVKTEQYMNMALEALMSRYHHNTHLMIHADPRSPWRQRLRRWVANFADQIYAVQAFALVAIKTGDDRVKLMANNLANQLVKFQGEWGQWWWHYNPRHGKVIQSYPVYSVHQHSMAPMAFAALNRATGQDLSAAIERGRAWLSHNELNINLIDDQAQTIWRDIDYRLSRFKEVSRKVHSLLGHPSNETTAMAKLALNYETRPYEWGWCLYSGAIEANTGKKLHLV